MLHINASNVFYLTLQNVKAETEKVFYKTLYKIIKQAMSSVKLYKLNRQRQRMLINLIQHIKVGSMLTFE